MSRAGPEEFTGVRAVTFDLFDTLARFWPPREQIQAQALQAFAIEVTPEGIDRGYALADAYMARENASGVPVRMRPPEATAAFFAEYERLVLHGAGVEVSRETAWRVWQEVRKIRYDLALFDDVLPSLRRLKELGLALGLISNINRTGPDLLQSLGLEGCWTAPSPPARWEQRSPTRPSSWRRCSGWRRRPPRRSTWETSTLRTSWGRWAWACGPCSSTGTGPLSPWRVSPASAPSRRWYACSEGERRRPARMGLRSRVVRPCQTLSHSRLPAGTSNSAFSRASTKS